MALVKGSPPDKVKTPTTVPATSTTVVVDCDLNLQSLRDAVESLLTEVGASGQGDARKVALDVTILLDVLTPNGLRLSASWVDKA